MTDEFPSFWQQQADMLELQAEQHLQAQSLPPLDFRFMTYCIKQQGDSSERILHLDIEGHSWTLIRREGVGISWEIQSPDQLIRYATHSQIENRLDREILDYRARLLASEQWEEKINLRLSKLKQKTWKWPTRQFLKLYYIEWEGFKQREEKGWTHSITPDPEGFVLIHQGPNMIGIHLDKTHHFVKRYQFDSLQSLPQDLIVQRQLKIQGLSWHHTLYLEDPGQTLEIPIGYEPRDWIMKCFLPQENAGGLISPQAELL